MNSWTRFVAVLTIASTAGLINAADDKPAADKPQKAAKADKTAKAQKAGKKVAAVRGEVVSVDGGTLKIKTGKKADAKELTIATDASTAVMIEGKAAKLADLKPGQRVNVIRSDEAGTGPAAKIVVPGPKSEKTPKAEKRADKAADKTADKTAEKVAK